MDAATGVSVSNCERSNDTIAIELHGPGGQALCVGEYPSYPPIEFEGVITQTTPTSVAVDACAPDAGCAPSVSELRVQAEGLDLSKLPVGAFVRGLYHCITTSGYTGYYTELTTVDSFEGAPSPAGPGGVLLLAASQSHSVFESSGYDVEHVALDCDPSGRDYALVLTSRAAPANTVHVEMGETASFDLGTPSLGGHWSVRNLHSHRNETPCAARGCSYSEFDDIAFFIAWSPAE